MVVFAKVVISRPAICDLGQKEVVNLRFRGCFEGRQVNALSNSINGAILYPDDNGRIECGTSVASAPLGATAVKQD